MFLVISGTNRPDSNSLRVARRVVEMLEAGDHPAQLLDLQELPAELFAPASYAQKPESFARFQQAIDDATGIVTVVAEYNGSFPGALKYFVDMLRFPGSLAEKPCGFVGLSAGRWGGIRAVEQLESVYLYRKAQPYAERVFLHDVHRVMDTDGRFADPGLEGRLSAFLQGFTAFTAKLT